MEFNITVGKHRGVPCFVWRINRKPRYRKIEHPIVPRLVEKQRQQLLVELYEGKPGGITFRAKPLLGADGHVADFIALKRTEMKPTNQGKKGYPDHLVSQLTRIFTAAKMTTTADINETDLRTVVASFTSTPRKPGGKTRPLTQQTTTHYLKAVKNFTSWLWRERRIKEDPLVRMKLKRIKARAFPRDRIHQDELPKFLSAVSSSTRITEGFTGLERAFLYHLAVTTGYRKSELAQVRSSSFKTKDGARQLRLAGSYTKNGEEAVQPLNKEIMAAVQRWLAEIPDDRLLFPGLEEKDAAKMFERDLADAGIEKETPDGKRVFHSLRNTYISMLNDAGVDIKTMQTLARHSDVNLTMSYVRVSPEALVSAVERFPALQPPLENVSPASTPEGSDV